MPVPLTCEPPLSATFAFSPTPPFGIYPLASSGPSSLPEDMEPCFDFDRFGDGAGLQLSVNPPGDGVLLWRVAAPVPEGICSPSPEVFTSLRVMNAFVTAGDFDRRFSSLVDLRSSGLRCFSRSLLPAGIWSSLSKAMFHSRSNSVVADCAGARVGTTFSASRGFCSAIGLRSI